MGSSYGSIRLWWEVVENRIEVKRLPQAVPSLMHKTSSSSSSSLIDQIVCHSHRGRHCHTHHHPLPKWCLLHTSKQGFALVRAYFLTFFKECLCDTTRSQNDPVSAKWDVPLFESVRRVALAGVGASPLFPEPLSASNLWTRVEPLWDWYCGLWATLEHWYFAQLVSQTWQALKQLNIWTVRNG